MFLCSAKQWQGGGFKFGSKPDFSILKKFFDSVVISNLGMLCYSLVR